MTKIISLTLIKIWSHLKLELSISFCSTNWRKNTFRYDTVKPDLSSTLKVWLKLWQWLSCLSCSNQILFQPNIWWENAFWPNHFWPKGMTPNQAFCQTRNSALETQRNISNIFFDFICLNLKQRSGTRMETFRNGNEGKKFLQWDLPNKIVPLLCFKFKGTKSKYIFEMLLHVSRADLHVWKNSLILQS